MELQLYDRSPQREDRYSRRIRDEFFGLLLMIFMYIDMDIGLTYRCNRDRSDNFEGFYDADF
jgi:hypothetical protein